MLITGSPIGSYINIPIVELPERDVSSPRSWQRSIGDEKGDVRIRYQSTRDPLAGAYVLEGMGGGPRRIVATAGLDFARLSQ
jgi:hypothetical protein